MNQGGALVNVYTDGTVLVSHGGMEMGQGLHTKVIQITARALGIAHEMVHISETNTSNVPNAIATAGSMGTDLYGMAVLNACEQINSRLQPVKEAMPETSTWPEIVNSAYFQRINLSAQGFYKVPTERCGYDWNMQLEGTSAEENAKRGHPFNYFTQGAACTEVEIDCLTVRLFDCV
jgi:xanthine dehydrogenase/oxidase